MNKADIQKCRIDIISGNECALSMLLCRDGTLGRQGSGKLPADKVAVRGMSDGKAFTALIDMLDEKVFPHANVYDHPNKVGLPITYSIAFLGKGEEVAVFEFRFGSETRDVGELLPYFDVFIGQAIALTNDWYEQEKLKAGSVH